MQSKDHWENVYSTKSATAVSWFQEHAAVSLKLIQSSAAPDTAEVIDIGGGASTLVDDLLDRGFKHLSVLDLSASALAAAKARLGLRAQEVKWLEANVLEVALPASHYDLWHDRAAFHFMTTPEARSAYVQKVLSAVKLGGIVVVSSFAEDGPTQCSGLPVIRYSAHQLHAEFGYPFELISHEREDHQTPSGNEQKFVYCVCRKVA